MPAAAFEDLTPRGRANRLRRLVPDVLAHHDIAAARIRLVTEAFNTTFRIDATDGRRYALRVGAAWRLHTDTIAEVEAVWTEALATDTDVRPPRVVRTCDGAASVWASAEGVPEARECVLFTWQDGRPLRGRMGDDRLLDAAGAVMATLHEHAATYDGVTSAAVLRADRVCYFRLPQVLVARYGTLFADGLAWAQEGVDALWRARGSQAQLLHGDVHPGNLLVRHRRVVPIDFQDAVWGPVEHDLAITLTSLDRHDQSGALIDRFRSGYERRRPWPDIDGSALDRLTIARRLHVANFMLHVWPSRATAYVAELADDLRPTTAQPAVTGGPGGGPGARKVAADRRAAGAVGSSSAVRSASRRAAFPRTGSVVGLRDRPNVAVAERHPRTGPAAVRRSRVRLRTQGLDLTTALRRRRRLLGGAALASTLCATVLAAPAASARTTSGAPHEPSSRSTVPGTPFREPSSRRSPAAADAMIWPVEGELTSRFGPRGGRLHRGVDIAAPIGTAVRAARDGTVSFAGWKGGYGRTLDIDHGGGQTTRLAHQSELLVTEGMRVRRGQLVGRVGTTGSSTGPHLHFELIVAGRERDPLAVLPARA